MSSNHDFLKKDFYKMRDNYQFLYKSNMDLYKNINKIKENVLLYNNRNLIKFNSLNNKIKSLQEEIKEIKEILNNK